MIDTPPAILLSQHHEMLRPLDCRYWCTFHRFPIAKNTTWFEHLLLRTTWTWSWANIKQRLIRRRKRETTTRTIILLQRTMPSWLLHTRHLPRILMPTHRLLQDRQLLIPIATTITHTIHGLLRMHPIHVVTELRILQPPGPRVHWIRQGPSRRVPCRSRSRLVVVARKVLTGLLQSHRPNPRNASPWTMYRKSVNPNDARPGTRPSDPCVRTICSFVTNESNSWPKSSKRNRPAAMKQRR